MATTATTYLLILVGGLVRASGAGMGCPDWPKCFGLWVPPFRADQLPPAFDPRHFNAALTWTEYLNRLLGATTGLLILLTLVVAVARHRREPGILWPSAAAAVGVAFQGWLGGRVVAHGLAPWIVTAHLLVALGIVSLLLVATTNAFFLGREGKERRPDRLQESLSLLLLALTLGQIALGTVVRSGVDRLAASSVDRREILAGVGTVLGAHALLAIAVAAISFWAWSAVRRGAPSRALGSVASAVVALAALQVLLGGLLSSLALPRPLQVLHLGVASLLLGAETLFALLLWAEGSSSMAASLPA